MHDWVHRRKLHLLRWEWLQIYRHLRRNMMHTKLCLHAHEKRIISFPIPKFWLPWKNYHSDLSQPKEIILKIIETIFFTLWIVCVPQMNRTELNPDPYFSKVSLLNFTTSSLFCVWEAILVKKSNSKQSDILTNTYWHS